MQGLGLHQPRQDIPHECLIKRPLLIPRRMKRIVTRVILKETPTAHVAGYYGDAEYSICDGLLLREESLGIRTPMVLVRFSWSRACALCNNPRFYICGAHISCGVNALSLIYSLTNECAFSSRALAGPPGFLFVGSHLIPNSEEDLTGLHARDTIIDFRIHHIIYLSLAQHIRECF